MRRRPIIRKAVKTAVLVAPVRREGHGDTSRAPIHDRITGYEIRPPPPDHAQ